VRARRVGGGGDASSTRTCGISWLDDASGFRGVISPSLLTASTGASGSAGRLLVPLSPYVDFTGGAPAVVRTSRAFPLERVWSPDDGGMAGDGDLDGRGDGSVIATVCSKYNAPHIEPTDNTHHLHPEPPHAASSTRSCSVASLGDMRSGPMR
jgi:hypothetical protein